MNFDLIIFDCDGVLVDSEVISCRAHAETLTRHGYPITAEQVLERFLGRSMRQATLEVEAELGRSLPDDFQSQTYAEIFRLFASFAGSHAAYSASADAIAQPVCVASSGPPEKISASLNRALACTIGSRRIFFPPCRCAMASRRLICFCSPPSRCRPRLSDAS